MSGSIHPASPQARRDLVLGVVGGSGLYGMEQLHDVHEAWVQTPFGEPSAAFTVGHLPRSEGEPIKCVFLPRHGPGHTISPTQIPVRANIHGFKQLGVTHLVAVSAVGSLQEHIAPGHMVVPDQLLDRTRARDSTFFGEGLVAHVQFGDPMDAGLRERVLEAARSEAEHVHDGGTCVVMEGPAFSTRAESELYRAWGASVIGMTALPEAKLAREAEMAYALLATSTDYDCWHVSEQEVTVEAVIAVVRANVKVAQAIVRRLAAALPATTEQLPYPRACEHAIVTAPTAIGAEARERLDLIVGHYLQEQS